MSEIGEHKNKRLITFRLAVIAILCTIGTLYWFQSQNSDLITSSNTLGGTLIDKRVNGDWKDLQVEMASGNKYWVDNVTDSAYSTTIGSRISFKKGAYGVKAWFVFGLIITIIMSIWTLVSWHNFVEDYYH